MVLICIFSLKDVKDNIYQDEKDRKMNERLVVFLIWLEFFLKMFSAIAVLRKERETKGPMPGCGMHSGFKLASRS